MTLRRRTNILAVPLPLLTTATCTGTNQAADATQSDGAADETADEAIGPAAAAITELPAEAFIVKENYAPDSSLVAVTAMYKVDEYDPGQGNWFWAKYTPDGSVDASGSVTSYQECHADGADYVLTDNFGQSGS